MSFDLCIKGRIVLAAEVIDGWVAAEGGRIVAIGSGAMPAAREAFDAGLSYVLPGIVDGQTHAGSYAGLAGLKSTSRAAIAGGVTTMVDMPYDSPTPLHDAKTLAEKIEAIEALSHCDVALYGTLMPDQASDGLKSLIEGGIAAVKISAFESSPTRFPRISAAQMLDMFEALAPTAIPLGIHNEDQEIVLARMARLKAQGASGISAHSASRPPAAELASTAQFLEIGAAAGAHAHLVHLSSQRGFKLVDHYRRDGFRATGETCVHYLWFDPAIEGETQGARMKVNPPIRPGERDGLWQAIKAGEVAFNGSSRRQCKQ